MKDIQKGSYSKEDWIVMKIIKIETKTKCTKSIPFCFCCYTID